MNKLESLETIVYVIAHADDWQLFMTPDAYYDIIAEDRQVVFIVTTAGDAGKNDEYWQAREEGMKSSVLFCLNRRNPPISREGKLTTTYGRVSWWKINTVSCYFLRLPDGGVHGEGFEKHNFANLLRLENGSIAKLYSLDKQLSLSSWNCFENLLSEIVSSTCPDKENIICKFLNPDAQSNPCDHSDHQCTGRAVLTVLNRFHCTGILFKGYGNSFKHVLNPQEIFWKTAMFAVYDKTVYERTGYSTFDEDRLLYQKWILSKPEFDYLLVTQDSF